MVQSKKLTETQLNQITSIFEYWCDKDGLLSREAFNKLVLEAFAGSFCHQKYGFTEIIGQNLF